MTPVSIGGNRAAARALPANRLVSAAARFPHALCRLHRAPRWMATQEFRRWRLAF